MAPLLAELHHRLARPGLPLVPRHRGDRLDRHLVLLRRARQPPARARARGATASEGVGGESWEIHGGGFYRIHKFRVAPPHLPKPLHWYKWEAYWTWLSGFALLCIVYYADARLRLIDPSVADLEPWQAILISIGLLVVAWLVYDVALPLCSPTGRSLLAARDARPRHRDRLRGRAALPAARGVPPGRRDARDDHGRERPVRDHPRPLGARPREGGGPRARPEAGHRSASSARCTTAT